MFNNLHLENNPHTPREHGHFPLPLEKEQHALLILMPGTALHMFLTLRVHNHSPTCGFSAGMMDTALYPHYSKDRKQDPGRLSCLPQVAEMEVYSRSGSVIPAISH